MSPLAGLILPLLFILCTYHVSGLVAALATKTYDVYDRPTPRLDSPWASITPRLELRQFSDPNGHSSRTVNSRPAIHPSVLHTPVTINDTQECALWNPACLGNRTAALLDFFDETMPALMEDSCFTTGPQSDTVCTKNPAPGPSLINSWSTIRSWMRSPACQTAREEAHRLDPSNQAHDPPIDAGCCGTCGVGGPNVDVYYWESPNANTDCLSIVGTDVAPLLDGATTKEGTTYWAVTTAGTDEDNSIFTTAVYTSVNGIFFKLPLHNPWDAMTCTDGIHQSGRPTSTTSAALPGITPPAEVPSSVNTRANVIPIRNVRPRAGRTGDQRNSITTEAPFLSTNGSQVSTVVYNGHIFTSPSIYVDFYSLAATDDCGCLGSSDLITSTLLSFSPGELSTYGGPLINLLHGEIFTPTAYNFADLPCPPQSIMYDQWYKPEPGHPFRPILAFPSKKVLDIDPAWTSCAANLFTGIDPPRALGSTNAMAAPVKTHDAFAPQTTSVPVPAPTIEIQAQAPSAPEQQDPQIVAPQKPTPPPAYIIKDKSFTDIPPARPGSKPATPQISGAGPAKPGNKEAGPQRSNEVAVPSTQTFASVGGLPIVALALQQASGSLDYSISVTASATSNLAAEKYQEDWTKNIPNQSDDFLSRVYQVGSSQITPGGPTLTVSGTVVFAPTSCDCVVVGDQTFHPSHLSDGLIGSAPTTKGAQPTSIGEEQHETFNAQNDVHVPNSQGDSPALTATDTAGKTFIRLPSDTGIAVDGITLSAGGPAITLSGTPVSLDSDYKVNIAGSIYALPASSAFSAKATGKGDVAKAHAGTATTIAGESLERVGDGISVVGTILPPGVKLTGAEGQVVSNAGNGIVVVGNQTAELGIPSAGTSARSATTRGNILPFEGRASRKTRMVSWQWAWSFAAIFVGLVRQ